MSVWIKHLLHNFLHPVDWELERYLASASDNVDLERRMRDWERTRRSPF